jgi:hypothetical protein
MKTVSRIEDFLTIGQIIKARKLMPDAKKIRDEVVTPNMAEIDRKLGQQNDPMYIAYMVVYLLR